MSKFRYQPEIQDVLRKQMPPSVVQQLLRRDHSLEDYLANLPAPTTGGGTGALTAKRDNYTGGAAALATDPTLSASTLTWAASSPAEGGVTSTGGASKFTAAATGLYLVNLIVGFDPNAAGYRSIGVATDWDTISSGTVPATVPPGINMQLSVSGSTWVEVGDDIVPYAAQSSGGDLGVAAQITITQLVVA